jgi:hypothetical protein
MGLPRWWDPPNILMTVSHLPPTVPLVIMECSWIFVLQRYYLIAGLFVGWDATRMDRCTIRSRVLLPRQKGDHGWSLLLLAIKLLIAPTSICGHVKES